MLLTVGEVTVTAIELAFFSLPVLVAEPTSFT